MPDSQSLILFAVALVAGIVCFRLFLVLGRRTGHEPTARSAPAGEKAPSQPATAALEAPRLDVLGIDAGHAHCLPFQAGGQHRRAHGVGQATLGLLPGGAQLIDLLAGQPLLGGQDAARAGAVRVQARVGFMSHRSDRMSRALEAALAWTQDDGWRAQLHALTGLAEAL